MSRHQEQYDIRNWMGMVEEELRKLRGASGGVSIPGLQLLDNGVLFAQGGLAVGGGGPGSVIAEPPQVPVPTGLSLSWGSSFDTIFIDVSWSAPAGYGADQVVAYLVQATKFGITVPIQQTVNATHVRLEPVEPNSTYTVQVSAITKTGKNSSVATDTILTGGDTTAPAAPTFPASPVLEAVQALSIKWNANTERDVANGAGQYRVIVSTNSDLSSPVYDARQSGTVAWVGGLEAGTDYYVGVYAIDSSGNQSATAGIPSGGPWQPAPNVTDTSAIAFGGGNVVRNSGFEDGTTNWAFSGDRAITTQINVVSSQYHGPFGTKSLEISGEGDFYGYTDVALTKGTYVLSGWVRAQSVAAVSGTALGVCLQFRDD